MQITVTVALLNETVFQADLMTMHKSEAILCNLVAFKLCAEANCMLYAHTQIQVITRLAEYGPHRWSGGLLQFMITCTWAYMCLSCHCTEKFRADTAIYIHCSENHVTLLSCSDGSYSTGPCQVVQAYLALATAHSPLPHPGSTPAAQQSSSDNAESHDQ